MLIKHFKVKATISIYKSSYKYKLKNHKKMRPEKLVGIMLITLLLSCEMEEQPDRPAGEANQGIGEVSFETNHHIMNNSFDIDIFIDQKKVKSLNKNSDFSETETGEKVKLEKKLEAGVHTYEVKVYSYNGEPSKTIKGKFIVKENRKSEVFIDFRDYYS